MASNMDILDIPLHPLDESSAADSELPISNPPLIPSTNDEIQGPQALKYTQQHVETLRLVLLITRIFDSISLFIAMVFWIVFSIINTHIPSMPWCRIPWVIRLLDAVFYLGMGNSYTFIRPIHTPKFINSSSTSSELQAAYLESAVELGLWGFKVFMFCFTIVYGAPWSKWCT